MSVPEDLNTWICHLNNVNSNDEEERNNSFSFLQFCMSENPRISLLCLSSVINIDRMEDNVVFQALNIIMLIVKPKRSMPLPLLIRQWGQTSANIRESVKNSVLKGLSSPLHNILMTSAENIALIAQLEFGIHLWKDLVPWLIEHLVDENTYSIDHKVAICYVIQCLIKKQLINERRKEFNDEGLMIINGFKTLLMHPDIQESHVKVILDSLASVLHVYFCMVDCENDLTVIVSHVKDIIVSKPCFSVICAGVGFLYQVFEIFYAQIPDHMGEIFEVLALLIDSGDISLAIQAIDTFTRFVLYEYSIIVENNKCALNRQSCNRYCHNISSQLFESLIPHIIKMMESNDDESLENPDPNDEYIYMNAASLLKAMNKMIPDQVIPFVSEYFRENYSHQSWNIRYSAILSLSSILKGPKYIERLPIISEFIPVIIELSLYDPSLLVRSSTMWTLSRIIRYFPDVSMDHGFVNNAIHVAKQHASSEIFLCMRSCIIIYELGRVFNDNNDHMSSLFIDMIEIINEISERPDIGEEDLFIQCYGAYSKIIEKMPKGSNINLKSLLDDFLTKINQYGLMLGSLEDTSLHSRIMGSLLGVLYYIITRMGESINEDAEKIVALLNNCLSLRNCLFHEDALIDLAAIVSILSRNSRRFLEQLIPLLIDSYDSFNASIIRVCSIALSRLYHSVGADMSIYTTQFFTILIGFLSDESYDLTVQSSILSAISEMLSNTVTVSFEFIPKLFNILYYLTENEIDVSNKDCIKSMNEFYESMILVYSSIIFNLKQNGDCGIMISEFRQVSRLFEKISKVLVYLEKSTTEKLLLFLEHVIQTIGREVNHHLHKSVVSSIIEYARRHQNRDISYRANLIHKQKENI